MSSATSTTAFSMMSSIVKLGVAAAGEAERLLAQFLRRHRHARPGSGPPRPSCRERADHLVELRERDVELLAAGLDGARGLARLGRPRRPPGRRPCPRSTPFPAGLLDALADRAPWRLRPHARRPCPPSAACRRHGRAGRLGDHADALARARGRGGHRLAPPHWAALTTSHLGSDRRDRGRHEQALDGCPRSPCAASYLTSAQRQHRLELREGDLVVRPLRLQVVGGGLEAARRSRPTPC